jgi:hypothetical protein
MRAIAAAMRIAGGGLALALLAPPVIAPGDAQEGTSAQRLIERLQQIQGQPQPGAAPPEQGKPASAEELVRQIELQKQSLAAGAAGQQPALGEEEVRRLVQDGLGVQVLRIETVEHAGRPAYAVTVMNPPGNYNGAFLVATLLVDGTTGGLLGQMPRTPSASEPDALPTSRAAGPDGSGLEIRRRTYR